MTSGTSLTLGLCSKPPSCTSAAATVSFNVVSLPELSVYSNRDRAGVAEFSGFLYEAKTGAPLGAVLPMIGQYRIRSHKLFMVVTWGQQQAQPGQRDPGSSWTEF